MGEISSFFDLGGLLLLETFFSFGSSLVVAL
jgi:hypothetical protein